MLNCIVTQFSGSYASHLSAIVTENVFSNLLLLKKNEVHVHKCNKQTHLYTS